MVLTPEQKERIRVNRERAYQLKQQRLRQQQEEGQGENGSGKKRGASSRKMDGDDGDCKDGSENIGSPCNEAKRPKTVSNLKDHEQEQDEKGVMRGTKIDGKNTKRNNDEDQKVEKKEKDDDEEDIILEEFEINASKYVTKNEAKHMYCLPEGTLAICEYIEKENPHNKLWKPMKMYLRSDIRRRARQRFGGMDGLIKEREQRQQRQYNKDLQQTKNIFTK